MQALSSFFLFTFLNARIYSPIPMTLLTLTRTRRIEQIVLHPWRERSMSMGM